MRYWQSKYPFMMDGVVIDKIQLYKSYWTKFKLKQKKLQIQFYATDLLIIQHTGRFEQYLGELAYICSLIVVPNRKSDDLPFNRIIITISTKGLLGDTHHVHWGSTQCSCHHLTRKEPCKPKVSWRKDSQIKFPVDQHFFTKWFQNRLLRISNIKYQL